MTFLCPASEDIVIVFVPPVTREPVHSEKIYASGHLSRIDKRYQKQFCFVNIICPETRPGAAISGKGLGTEEAKKGM